MHAAAPADLIQCRIDDRGEAGHVAYVTVNNPEKRNTLGMPEVRVGIPSGMEANLLPALIGWGKAAELIFTGDIIDADEAFRCGFLQKLVPAAQLDAAVEKMVASILLGGPRAIRLQKRLMRDWERMSLTDGIWQGIRACVAARSTDEPRRMMEAFIARKRK